MKYLGRLFHFGIVAVLLLATAAWADDPPGRVARLEYMTGSVSVQPRGTEDWVQGSANRPLTNADNIWADKDSRAELNLGTGLMRISSESSLTLTNVNNDTVQVQLHQGTLNVHIRHLYGGEIYEIDTPNLAFTVSKSGDYRFDVDPNGDSTIVTVRKGEGQATGQGPAVKIRSGEQANFTGGNSLAHQIHDAPRPDGFDDWCRVRDEREDHSVSARYVAPGVVGTGDLDANGTWREVPDYGPVWVPTSVAPGWAPYRYGHWIWVEPWGWTWEDDAPWGFAPFHYGRWVTVGGYWGWAPGPYWARPWYSPAMVAWFGGPGWGVSFGFGFGGGWGWCPLGFGEPFFPWWGHGFSRGYFRNVNISNTRITNITNITNNYYNHPGTTPYGTRGIAATPRYAVSHNGLTAASANTLQHSLPVNTNMAHIPESGLRNLTASARGPEVTPTHESVLGSRSGIAAAHPTSTAASRPTVSRMTPPPSPARTTESSAASARGPENSSIRSSANTPGRTPESTVARNSASSAINHNPASAGAVPSAGGLPGPAGRSVPRPPSSFGNGASPIGNSARQPGMSGGSRTTEPSRSEPTQMAMNHYVPRPPSANSSRMSEPTASTGSRSLGSSPSGTSIGRSVPRPPEGSMSRPSESARNTVPSYSGAPRSYSSPTSSSAGRNGGYNIPRPTGAVRPAPSQSASGYSGRSSGSFGGYGSSSGGSRGYSSPRSYGGGGSYGGHYSAPSHGSFGGGGGSHGGSGGGFHGGGSASHGGGGGHR